MDQQDPSVVLSQSNDSVGTATTVQVSHEVLILIGVYLSIVAVFATVGNGSFVVVLLRCRAFCRDAHLILLMSMSVCDLGVSFFGYPFTIWSCFAGSWVFGDAICQMYSFVCYTLNLITANTLVVISVFRYIIICKPQMKHRLTPRLSCFCIIGTVCYALIWTIPPFFGISSYIREPFEVSCSIDWFDNSVQGMTYIICVIFFCYVTHLTIMGWCYYQIHQRVSQLKLDPLTPPLPLTLQSSAPPATRHHEGKSFLSHFFCFDAEMNFDNVHRHQKSYNLELQVLKLNIMMVLSFFIIWSPYAIVSIISFYYHDIPAFWYVFPTIFAKTSCMINPMLYGLTNASLRKEFRKLWTGCCSKRPHEDTTTSHRSIVNQEPGGDGRLMYDKEGVYLGKVNQGTCACSGCIESRREVEMLIRLQTQRTREQEKSRTEESAEEGTPTLEMGKGIVSCCVHPQHS